MKIALLQCNTVTGDVAGNAERILAAVREAAAQGADLCVTPELALCGVAPGSYLRAEDFAEGCKAGLQMLADALQDGPPLLVGAPVARVYAAGLRKEVRRTLFAAEFKRRQEPLGLHISRMPFGTGWQVPVAGRYRMP